MASLINVAGETEFFTKSRVIRALISPSSLSSLFFYIIKNNLRNNERRLKNSSVRFVCFSCLFTSVRSVREVLFSNSKRYKCFRLCQKYFNACRNTLFVRFVDNSLCCFHAVKLSESSVSPCVPFIFRRLITIYFSFIRYIICSTYARINSLE